MPDELTGDAELLELAREQLRGLFRSDNEQIRLRAATALHTYRAIEPPGRAAGLSARLRARAFDLTAPLREFNLNLGAAGGTTRNF